MATGSQVGCFMCMHTRPSMLRVHVFDIYIGSLFRTALHEVSFVAALQESVTVLVHPPVH
eukprot:4507972-Amphidinium_carterae.1